MPIRRCPSPEDAQAAYDALIESGDEALFTFFGSEDPQTGESWCPDCVTADPLIRLLASQLRGDLTLYECPVGLRSEWKGQDAHPYRQHPAWRLERIPTLIHLRGASELGRLLEADCSDEALLRRFLTGAAHG